MKFFNIVFILVFILFAALQYNDPDPYLWMPIYLYPAVLCYLAAKQKPVNKMAYWVGFLIFGVYAMYKFFDANGILDWIKYHHATSIAATMKAEQPWVEESREFFGLVIILAVMAFNYFKGKKSNIA
jgi:Transmembrane family 220, helix